MKNTTNKPHSQFALLQQRKFLPLFLTQFLGAFNDNVLKNAIVILITFQIFALTPPTWFINFCTAISLEKTCMAFFEVKLLVTLCAGLFILPFFLFSATAGQIADKYEKSRLIRIIKIIEIGIMSIVFAGFLLKSITLLLLALFLMGAQSSLFGPLKYSILPQHLTKDELLGGNAIVEAGTFLSILIGTIIGGLLVAYGAIGPIAVSILCIIISIIGYFSSRYIPSAQSADKNLRINWNIPQQIYRSIGIVGKNPEVLLAVLAISWFWFYGAIYLSQLPTFTKDILRGNEEVVTAFFTCFSVGIGVGSVLCDKLSNHQVRLGLVTIGAIGLSLFAFDLYYTANHYLVANSANLPDEYIGFISYIKQSGGIRIMLDLLLLGTFGGMYCVPLYTQMQLKSDENTRSRVIATNNIINSFFMVVSALIAIAILLSGFSVKEVLLFPAIINILIIVYFYYRAPDYVNRIFAFLKFSKKQ